MSNSGFEVFDCDLHVLEPPDLWTRYVDAEFKDRVPVGDPNRPAVGLIAAQDGTPWGGQRPSKARTGHNTSKQSNRLQHYVDEGWTGRGHLEAMDAEGIDLAVLFPTRGLFALSVPDMDRRLAAAMARAYNDWLYDFMEPDRDRMFGAGMISPFDVDDAIAETRRCVNELGFKSVFMRANLVAERNWHDPYYDPLWAEISDLGIAMTFHEATGAGGGQVGDRYAGNLMLWHIICHPFDQMIALTSFCCGGILERHPDLRVAFLEGNCSWAPFFLWRMDEHFETLGDDFGQTLTKKPSDYFRQQCWVAVESDEDPVRYAIADGLTDRIVYSTDFPHFDSKFPHSVERFLKLEISDPAKRQILWDNCKALYAFD